MKLAAYLREHDLTMREFAEKIDIPDARTIHRYVSGQRIPRPGIMNRISVVTGGAVQPNDFFEAIPGTTEKVTIPS